MIRQAEVYEWATGGRSRYVVVLSNDDYSSASGLPICARIVHRGPGVPASPLFVPLADADPVGGLVVVGPVAPVPVGELVRQVGMLTGQTWSHIQSALGVLFGT